MHDKIKATRDIWYHDLRPVFFGLETATTRELEQLNSAVNGSDEVVIPEGSEGIRTPGTTLVTFEVNHKGMMRPHGCHPPHYCIEVTGHE